MASLMAGTVPQTYDTAAPATIPVRAPMAVTRRQYNARRIIGPKAAPKPAHAKPTRSNTVESGFCAISAAMMLTTTDRKSTRLNSSHVAISYAVFCLKKKKKKQHTQEE